MATFGLGDFCQPFASLDVDRLKEQFHALQARRGEVVGHMRAQSAANAERLDEQFAVLSATMLGGHPDAPRRSRIRQCGLRRMSVMVTTIGDLRHDNGDSP